MQKSDKLLICGIDPGTTLGFALMDFKGEVVFASSSKGMNLSLLIAKVISYGRPLIATTDVTPCPSFVKEFSAKTGAVLILPKKDMLVEDKRKLTLKYDTKDIHESDALAAAIFAFNELKPLITKINLVLTKRGNLMLLNKVTELVIKDKFSVHEAVEILEETPEVVKEEKTIELPLTVPQMLSKINYLKDKFKRTVHENLLLREQVNSLIRENEESKNRLLFILKKKNNLPKDAALIQKDKKVQLLSSVIESYKIKLNHSYNEFNKTQKLISSLNNSYLLKKLPNLGNDFEIRNKLLNVSQGDILFVEDIDIISPNTINFLKNKVFLIIYKKGSKKSFSLPFTFINSANLAIKETDNFAYIGKDELNNAKGNVEMLRKIIEEYRNQRN